MEIMQACSEELKERRSEQVHVHMKWMLQLSPSHGWEPHPETRCLFQDTTSPCSHPISFNYTRTIQKAANVVWDSWVYYYVQRATALIWLRFCPIWRIWFDIILFFFGILSLSWLRIECLWIRWNWFFFYYHFLNDTPFQGRIILQNYTCMLV